MVRPPLVCTDFAHKRLSHKRGLVRSDSKFVSVSHASISMSFILYLYDMDLVYDSGHQVVVCKHCQTCIGPSRTSIKQHLQKKPYQLTGQTLKSYLKYTDSLALWPLENL